MSLDGIRLYGPGMFSTYIDKYVYESTLDGGADEEFGECATVGWYGLVTGDSTNGLLGVIPNDVTATQAEVDFLRAQMGAIVSEEDQGFVYVEYFEDMQVCMRNWEFLKKANPEG